MKEEYILCAAIYINDSKVYKDQPENITNGFVVCGRRHGDCYNTIECIVGLGDEVVSKVLSTEMNLSLEEHRKRQGFMTSKNRFVNRKEAYQIAKAQNQLLLELNDIENPELISENLY